MCIQEVWTNVGLEFLLSVWLIETVALDFLKQVFLVAIFVPDGSGVTPMELAGHALSAENILKSFRSFYPCRWHKCCGSNRFLTSVLIVVNGL